MGTKPLKAVIFSQPVNFTSTFSIKSGRVDFLQAVGITLAELEFAKKTSSNEIIEKLVTVTGGLIASKERASVV